MPADSTDRSDALLTTTLVTAGRWTNQFILFGVLWYAAQALALEMFGMISIAISLHGLLAVATDFGSVSYIIPRVAGYGSIGREVLRGTFKKRLTVSGLLIIAVLAFGLATRMPSIDLIAYLLMAGSVIIASFDIQSFLDGLRRIDQGVLVALIRVVVLAAVSIGLFFILPSPAWAAVPLGYLTGASASACAGLFILRPSKHPRLPSGKAPPAPSWQELWPLALAALCIQLYYFSDVLIIGALYGKEPAGLYNAAYRLMAFFLVIGLSYQRTHFPRLPGIIASDGVLEYLRKSSSVLALVSAPIVIFGMVEAARIMPFIWGDSFFPGAKYLVWLLPNIIIASLSGVIGNVHLALDNRWAYLRVVGIAALLNVTLNIILIPLAGPIAATWTTILSEVVVIVLFLRLLRYGLWQILRPALGPLGSGIVVVLLLSPLRSGMHLLISLAIHTVIYGLIIVVVAFIRRRLSD